MVRSFPAFGKRVFKFWRPVLLFHVLSQANQTYIRATENRVEGASGKLVSKGLPSKTMMHGREQLAKVRKTYWSALQKSFSSIFVVFS